MAKVHVFEFPSETVKVIEIAGLKDQWFDVATGAYYAISEVPVSGADGVGLVPKEVFDVFIAEWPYRDKR